MTAPDQTAVAPTRWNDLRAALQMAREAELAYDAKRLTPGALPSVLAESDRLTGARCAAEEALIKSAGHNVGEVLFKVEYARRRWIDCDDWPEDWWKAVIADLQRLAGPRPSACDPLNVSLCPHAWQMAATLTRAIPDQTTFVEMWLTFQHRIGGDVFATEDGENVSIRVQYPMDSEADRRLPYEKAFRDALEASGHQQGVIDTLRVMGRIYRDPMAGRVQEDGA